MFRALIQIQDVLQTLTNQIVISTLTDVIYAIGEEAPLFRIAIKVGALNKAEAHAPEHAHKILHDPLESSSQGSGIVFADSQTRQEGLCGYYTTAV